MKNKHRHLTAADRGVIQGLLSAKTDSQGPFLPSAEKSKRTGPR